jgi:hypothetical protein
LPDPLPRSDWMTFEWSGNERKGQPMNLHKSGNLSEIIGW